MRTARCLCLLAGAAGACSGFRLAADATAPKDSSATADRRAADARAADAPCGSGADPHACGACGVDCLGGECRAGRCQPVTLAANRAAPQDLAVGSGFVYWVEQGTAAAAARDGKVLRIPVDGCRPPGAGCPTELASAVVSPGGIALGPADVFWLEFGDDLSSTATGKVWRQPLVGGAATPFATGQDQPRKVAADAQRLFWITASAVRGKWLDEGASDGVTLVGNQSAPVELAVRESNLYWTSYGTDGFDGTVMSASLDGSGAHSLATKLQKPRDITAGPTYVYWTNAGNGTVMRVDPTGGQAEAVVSSAATPNDVAVDLDWIYWLEGGTDPLYTDGRLMAMRLDGTGKRALAEAQIYPRSIALDGDAVYWVNRGTPGVDNFDGAVLKVARPR